MAVHDKRQRASSDGERLACEKEMAALEKLGTDMDSDLAALKVGLGFSLRTLKVLQKVFLK